MRCVVSDKKYIVVKKRDERSKWARTGTGPTDDVFTEESKAHERASQYKRNVPSWRFAYIVSTGGKVESVMEVR